MMAKAEEVTESMKTIEAYAIRMYPLFEFLVNVAHTLTEIFH